MRNEKAGYTPYSAPETKTEKQKKNNSIFNFERGSCPSLANHPWGTNDETNTSESGFSDVLVKNTLSICTAFLNRYLI